MKRNNAYAITAVAIFAVGVLYAALPLFGIRYIPTHDGEYHIIRIVEFSKMISAGYIFPRWAPTLNSGYGIPIFNFHYPLPNYIGTFIRFFTHDAVYAYQMAMGFGYVSVAISSLFWLRTLFPVLAAVAGATVASFVPYIFVDLYVRGSIGEIWATVFLFLTLAMIEKKKYVLAAISYALLIISHNILAMLYTPFLIAYCAVRDMRALASLSGGVGLSAYFWLPALMEQRYVVGLNAVNFREHFAQLYELLVPSWGTQFSATGSLGNKISFQLGLVPLSSIIYAVFIRRNHPEKNKPLLFRVFMVTGFALVFLVLPLAIPIWELFKPLQNIQYPWRLLTLMIPVSAYMTAYWVQRTRTKVSVIICMIAAVLFSASYARPVTYEPRNEAYYLSRKNFTDGTSSMGNSFTTVWTPWKEASADSLYEVTNGTASDMHVNRYMDKRLRVSMYTDGEIKFNIAYFPGWMATVDNKPESIEYMHDGIIHVHIPAGEHQIRIFFGNTPVRIVGSAVSVTSLVLLLLWGILHI